MSSTAPPPSRRKHWLKTFGGLAILAAFVALVYVLVQQGRAEADAQDQVLAAALAGDDEPTTTAVPTTAAATGTPAAPIATTTAPPTTPPADAPAGLLEDASVADKTGVETTTPVAADIAYRTAAPTLGMLASGMLIVMLVSQVAFHEAFTEFQFTEWGGSRIYVQHAVAYAWIALMVGASVVYAMSPMTATLTGLYAAGWATVLFSPAFFNFRKLGTVVDVGVEYTAAKPARGLYKAGRYGAKGLYGVATKRGPGFVSGVVEKTAGTVSALDAGAVRILTGARKV